MANIAGINGIVIANVAGMNGTVIANIAKVNGHDISAGPITHTFEFDTSKTYAYTSPTLYGIYVDPTGYKIAIPGDYDDIIYYDTLSIAFDISTSTYPLSEISMTDNYNNSMRGIDVFNSGNGVVIANEADSYTVTTHTISTPYDFSTISATVNNVFIIPAKPRCVRMSSDGTKLFVSCEAVTNPNSNPGHSYFYTLSTPYDVSTASLVGSVEIPSTYFDGFFTEVKTFSCLSEDGSKHFIIYSTGALNSLTVEMSELSTPWDYTTEGTRNQIGTATHLNVEFNGLGINTETDGRYGIYLIDGQAAGTNKYIYKYLY